MLTQTLKRRLEKSGIPVIKPEWSQRRYEAYGFKYRVGWYDQEGRAICVQVRSHNDHNDPGTDYSAGYFAKTIKDVIETLKQK